MKIPSNLKIGATIYKIIVKRFIKFSNPNIAGNINYNKRLITIKKTTDQRATEDIFFHELAHGLLKEMEFNYPAVTKFRHDELFTQELGLNLRKMFLELLRNQEFGGRSK